MSKAVVFGGSGFLGSATASELASRGFNVDVCDIAQYNGNSNVNYKKIDVTEVDQVHDATLGADIVYNFAGLSDLNEGLDDPVKTIHQNILANSFILGACLKNGVSRYMYASTIYVHSAQGGFYRCSKQACESYIREYNRRWGLGYTILRYGSLYGPGSDGRNGLYRMIEAAIKTKSIIYKGDTESVREYIHVADAASMSVDLLGEPYKDSAITITGTQQIKISELLEMLNEMLGGDYNIIKSESSNVSPGHYVRTPYNFSNREGLRYQSNCTVDFGFGIVELINYVRRRLGVDGDVS
jgi:UDP-glucose 4-epimerase